jgi:hypothetical protein
MSYNMTLQPINGQISSEGFKMMWSLNQPLTKIFLHLTKKVKCFTWTIHYLGRKWDKEQLRAYLVWETVFFFILFWFKKIIQFFTLFYVLKYLYKK